jgi:hypothetical protein
MNAELTKKLWEKYPKIFQGRYKSIQESLIPFGFECDSGWYNIIDSLCSNLQWNTDNNNKSYVIKNKFLRKLLPIIDKLFRKIPGQYNLERKTQINPLVIFRSFLLGLLHEWRTSTEWIYVESGRYPQVIATQVKEKFGGLRFYVQGASDVQYAVISFTESLSYKICEKCGSMNHIGQTQGWVTTLCKDCADPDSTWKEYEEETENIECEIIP